MKLVCPECKTKLFGPKKNGYNCTKCGLFYPLVKGIPSFLKESDGFYESKFTATQARHKSLLLRTLIFIYHSVSISSSRERFIKKAFRNVSTNLNKSNLIRILDIGCGGGREELVRFGEVIGIDISLGSLYQAQKVYRGVVQADISKMPFPDEYFDTVFSTDVMGHIPPEKKDGILREIFRVTRKGGFSVHSFECDSKSFFYKWAKKYPNLHQKYFIDMYGHVGLEYSIVAFKRFMDVGFIPVMEAADLTKGYLREVSSYTVFFDNEFRDYSKTIRAFMAICKFLSTQRILRAMSNFVLGFFVPFAALITPKSHRDSAKVIYQKPLGAME